jgi:DNA helicase-2/ATP-dependent DNA helicase PcrA
VPSDYLADLNDAQRQAVEHGVTDPFFPRPDPLLVIAGAGSGKTKTLASRVAHLIVNGVNSHRILLLTFSRRAAAEMTRRVERITASAIGSDHIDLPWSGTFHATGARILREYAPQIGLHPSFTILDRADAADLMNLVRHELGYSARRSRFPLKDTCLRIYSLAINSEVTIKQLLNSHFPNFLEWEEELGKLFAHYVDAKQTQNVLDYDDLLLYWAEMLQSEKLAAEIGGRFDHVLVDEYQDTNRLQAKILRSLKPTGQGLMVVGDDAQSIYSFRAATVRNILDFPNEFEPKARIITLEQNYRSTQPILEASNAVIGLAAERFTKNLRSDRHSQQRPFLTTVLDEQAQARHVCEQILEAREAGVPLKSQAVLFRSSYHSAQLELELGRKNIPFVKYGGLKFLEAAHIKDAISVLRWCENSADKVAGFRVLQLLSGIGPSTASKVLTAIERSPNKSSNLLAHFPVPAAAAEDWPGFVELMGSLTQREQRWPAELQLVRDWYLPNLERKYDDAHARKADLLQLEAIAGGYSSRQQFLTEVTLDPPGGTAGNDRGSPPEDDYLILSTIHSAKGQEWRVVHILNVVDGCIPSARAGEDTEDIEEERRLLYVAMTRARDELNFLIPHRFYTSRYSADTHVYGSLSRFIPGHIQALFESRTWSEKNSSPKPGERRAIGIDISAQLKQRWAV